MRVKRYAVVVETPYSLEHYDGYTQAVTRRNHLNKVYREGVFLFECTLSSVPQRGVMDLQWNVHQRRELDEPSAHDDTKKILAHALEEWILTLLLEH